MKLRKLMEKDAPLMLEWMHDPSCVENLQANFVEKTIEDCRGFIASSTQYDVNLHLAIVDEDDVYQGTVSLKNINHATGAAEFAIAIRSCAMGKGISAEAMREIIRIGLQELKLEQVYWCVSEKNKRAVRFYDKNGYRRTDAGEIRIEGYTKQQISEYIWYLAQRG